MPELDVTHFRKPIEQLPVKDVDSIEAPPRPAALDAEPLLEGELLDPDETSAVAVIAPAEHIPIFTPTLGPLHRINFAAIESRQQLMAELNAALPLNDFGLPRHFYRADLIDASHIVELARDRLGSTTSVLPRTGAPEIFELLENAQVPLDYHHGYPTLRIGTPFWERLDYETVEAYGAFAHYLFQPGARTLTQGELKAIPTEALTEWFHYYCWSHRARAYDMFRTTHQTRMRISRIMETEDDHYLMAQTALNKVKQQLNNVTQEVWESMDPDKLINMMEKLTKIQRVSAGLPAMGAPDEGKAPKPVSVEV